MVQKVKNALRKLFGRVGLYENNSGMGVIEVILIIVVLIGLVIIFKGQITTLVNNILSKITTQANSI